MWPLPFNVAGQDGNSALLKLKIRPGNGNWIRVGIRYKSGYDTDFTIRDLAADDKGYYQVNLKGLHPDATYQVRAFAISEKNLSEKRTCVPYGQQGYPGAARNTS